MAQDTWVENSNALKFVENDSSADYDDDFFL